jgi:hydrogenase maturation protease
VPLTGGAVARRVVVLGIGNVLQTDEGVGPHCVYELERRFEPDPAVMVIDGGTSAMELLEDMAKADLLLILDAVSSGRPAGSVVKLSGDEVPVFFTTKLSPHQVGIADVLAALVLTGESPMETIIIGVEPASLKLGMELSAAVAAAVPRVIDQVIVELRRVGIAIKPATAAAAVQA